MTTSTTILGIAVLFTLSACGAPSDMAGQSVTETSPMTTAQVTGPIYTVTQVVGDASYNPGTLESVVADYNSCVPNLIGIASQTASVAALTAAFANESNTIGFAEVAASSIGNAQFTVNRGQIGANNSLVQYQSGVADTSFYYATLAAGLGVSAQEGITYTVNGTGHVTAPSLTSADCAAIRTAAGL